ncbi:hypothetical protein [Nostoc sp.]
MVSAKSKLIQQNWEVQQALMSDRYDRLFGDAPLFEIIEAIAVY